MKDKIIKISRILLFLGIGIFFLFIAFRDIPLENLASGLRQARYEWVMVSLFFATLAFFSRALRWKLLIEPLGYRPSAKNTFYALMSGYFANFILPRIGELTRCGSLNRTDRIPADSLLGTVITERLSDILVLILLAATVFFIKIDLFGNFLLNYIIYPFFSRIVSLLELPLFVYFLILIIPLLLITVYRRVIPRVRKQGAYRKVRLVFIRTMAGMKSVAAMKNKTGFLAHTLFIWLMYFLMTWAVFMALPATSGLGGSDALFILVAGGLGMAAPVQGGFGTYHWIVSVGLSIYGIPREDGLIFALLSHESQALLMIALGSFSMMMIFLKWKKRAKHPENNNQHGNEKNGFYPFKNSCR